MKKILFFTAGITPTVAEVAKIAALNTLASEPYEVHVRNGKPRAKITAATISAATADHSLNDSGNGFLAAHFCPGMVVSVEGFTGDTANNVDRLTIDTVTAGKMKFVGTTGSAIVNDAAGESVTISSVDSEVDGSGVEDADYVAGTVPASYKDEDHAAIYPVFDIDAMPDLPTLPADQSVLSDGEEIDLGEDTVTAVVADHAITGVTLPATKCVVANAQQINVTGGGHVVLTIAGGAITGCAYTAPG